MDLLAGLTKCHIGNGPARGILAPEADPVRSRTIARKPPTTTGTKPPAKRKPPKPATALNEAAKAPGTPRKKAAAAGPKPRATRAAKAAPSELDKMQAVIVGSLEDDKAENVVVLDLAGRAAFTDRMVIATGLADRQITAMATHLQEKLHEAGVGRVPVEGAGGSDWVLIDAGDIVVHLFKPEARELYALEKMWGVELDEAVEGAA
jgi:ribosome silencing factor RsfS/YbeB/iojap